MSRRGNGSAGFDEIHVMAAGQVPLGGPFTIMALVRPEQTGFGGIVQSRTSADAEITSLLWDTSGTDIKYFITGDFTGSPAAPVGDWQIISVTKPAGTATVRYHLYTDVSGIWTHANGGAVADPTGPVDHVWIGRALGRFDGWLVALAWFDRVLTDSDHENGGFRTGLANWSAASPAALWHGGQAQTTDPILDVTGNGADETSIIGTRLVVEAVEPPGWSYSLSTSTERWGIYL